MNGIDYLREYCKDVIEEVEGMDNQDLIDYFTKEIEKERNKRASRCYETERSIK